MAEEQSKSEVVRDGMERVCEDFTKRIAALGFQRTKRREWTRQKSPLVDSIYFHRSGSSYGAPRNYSVRIRIHLSARTPGDDSPTGGLNGPNSDDGQFQAGRYHLRFNAQSGDTYERCLGDLVRFVIEQGEPWFNQASSP